MIVVVLIILCSFLAFYATRRQVLKLKECGSDHPVHLFLINKIRKNGHKLFSTVPDILNEAYLGAIPLFVHYVLSFLSPKTIKKATLNLNPVINALLVALMSSTSYLLVEDISFSEVFLVGSLIAFCPQFYHAFSARNFGLSSRPLGILLITGLVITNFLYISFDGQLVFMGIAVLLCYIIWGSNTFAQQTFILSGVIMGVLYADWFILTSVLISVFLFILIHNKYAISYLYRTGLFIYTYATQVAKLYILKQRYSIWRDLVYDLYVKLKNEPISKSVQYAYNNSILVVLILNPFIVITVLSYNLIDDPFLLHCRNFSISCFILFILTSFRSTRFLGEPERYAEMATCFSVLITVSLISTLDKYGLFSSFLFVFCFLLYLVQMLVVNKLRAHVSKKNNSLQKAEEFLNLVASENKDEVRFYSNSEHVTKMLMNNEWRFARFWSPDTKFAGYNFKEAYSQFPFYTRELSRDALEYYKINYVIYDKNNFIEEPSNEKLNSVEKIYEDENYTTFRLEWR